MAEWTQKQVDDATYWAKRGVEDAVERVERARTDAEPVARRAHRECRHCFHFRHGIAGQAFTNYECRACGNTASHPNTNTPKLCPACADARDLCIRCGGQREWKEPQPRAARRNTKKST